MGPHFVIATWFFLLIAPDVRVYFVGIEEQLTANPVASDLASLLKLVDSRGSGTQVAGYFLDRKPFSHRAVQPKNSKLWIKSVVIS
jgi:hypothetical protein